MKMGITKSPVRVKDDSSKCAQSSRLAVESATTWVVASSRRGFRTTALHSEAEPER